MAISFWRLTTSPKTAPDRRRSGDQGARGARPPDHDALPEWAGTVKLNSAPRGMFAVAHNRPPCASMIDWQIDSPNPNPEGLVVWKGSNRRSRTAGASPGPESRTSTSTPSGSALPALINNSRGPSLALLIAWMALRIKLRITCCSCTHRRE